MCWLLDAGSWHFCNQFSGLWCPWVSFGMLGASTLASWGTWDDPGTIPGRSWDDPGTLEGTRKDLVSSRLGFYRFFVDLGDPCWEFFGYLRSTRNEFFISISRSFFSDDFWVWIWVSGIGKPRVWQGKYCKNQLSQKLDSFWFQGQFFMILRGGGTNFHDFCCLFLVLLVLSVGVFAGSVVSRC